MNRLYAAVAAGSMLAAVGAAQDDHMFFVDKVAPQVRVMSLQSGVIGKPIKGAPYSAVEITESNQTLADGTRIHNEHQTQVYRDSEGRIRRETPNEVTIWDPVANTSYVLNPKTQTVRKLPLGTYVFSTKSDAGEGRVFSYSVRTGPPGEPIHAGAVGVGLSASGPEAEAKAVEMKLRAELETKVRLSDSGPDLPKVMMRKDQGTTESLGRRMIEGLQSDGTRTILTTEAGAIGNDRPIQAITEKWYSSDLQLMVLVRHTDPRTGEEISRLTNVNRAEPASYLFQIPAGYQMVEMK